MENEVTGNIGNCGGASPPPATLSLCKVPTDAMLFENGFGYFLSFVARNGYEDLNEAMTHYVEDAVKYHDERTKGSRQYGSGVDYIMKKLAIKKRNYMKLRNELN